MGFEITAHAAAPGFRLRYPNKEYSVKTILVALLLLDPLLAIAAAGHPGSKDIEKRVNDLLKKMTLEEKVGQMTQVALDVVSKGDSGKAEPHAIDPVKLETAIFKYHVGSILNVATSAHSIDHWHEIITQIQDAARKTRLGIPVIYGIDAIHGASYTRGATLFPQGIAVAATWSPDIAKRIGEVTAREVRASGIPWNFHPVLDLGRQPLWPRFWETYGEDVVLATRIGTSYISGLQGDDIGAPDKVAACLKHYAGYSFTITGKDRTSAWIDERMMRQYFLPTFEAGVRAGAMTVMVNAGETNGIPCHADYHLLTEVLKGEWKFRGFVVSDWEGIKHLYTRDRVADSPKEAVRIGVMAGIDMSMVPLDFSFYDLLLALVREKTVPLSRIDDAVRRILRVKFAAGLFEHPYPEPAAAEVGSKQDAELNLEAASEAITLLRNSINVLPLRKGTRVLVTGPTANLLSALNGGWTITWQGDSEELYPHEKKTILDAIREENGKENVVYVPGTSFDKPLNIAAAVGAADTCDVVIACLGEKAYCEFVGNIDDFNLEEAQLRLVEELSRRGKPVVLVLAEGRPRTIHRIVDKCSAVLMAYLPGMEGGTAVGKVLFGDVNPSGKLPFSYPKYPNAHVPYDGKGADVSDVNRYNPEFAFGSGLSYTTFEYSDLRLSKSTYSMKDTIEVSVTIKNKGTVTGKEVAQLFVTDLYRSVTPPFRELKGFSKLELRAAERRTVTFRLTAPDLSFIGKNYKRIVEPGGFRVAIDTLSTDFELKAPQLK